MELLLMDSTMGERTVQALPDLIITVLTVAVAWLLFQLLGSIEARAASSLSCPSRQRLSSSCW